MAGESTVTMINVLLGKRLCELNVTDPTSMKHRKVAIEEDEGGRLTAEVAYGDAKKKLHVTALMGMFLAQLKKRLGEETKEAEEVIISLALPPNHAKDLSVERAYREASTIAGIVADKLFVADATDCLVATYTRKIAGLNPSEREHLEVGCLLLILLFILNRNSNDILFISWLNRASMCFCWTWATLTLLLVRPVLCAKITSIPNK